MAHFILQTLQFFLVVVAVKGDLLEFLSREYYAYGYDPPQRLWEVESGVPNAYGYGLGGLEVTAYDPLERIVYGISEQGFITLVDYGNGPEGAEQLAIKIYTGEVFTSAHVCAEEGLVFVSAVNDVVYVYTTAKREENGDIIAPERIHQVAVGSGPDMVKGNADCTVIAVANEAEASYDDELGLFNPEGSVSLIRAPFTDDEPPEVVQVSLNDWTDEELIAKGVHLPVSLNALEYWDEHSAIADQLNFSLARSTYTPATVLEPEWIEWNPDGTELYVNLQENNAIVVVDVENAVAKDIYGFGLKCFDEVPIDLVDDGGCELMEPVPGLCAVREVDSIAVHTIGDETYIVTANEGDDVGYGAFEEKQKALDIFVGSELGPLGFTADPAIFDPTDPSGASLSRFFNAECVNYTDVEFCSTSLRMTLGSSMVDYSDPTAPHIHQMAVIGGRGISIYRVNEDNLELVWDSADMFEREGCSAYPWAHNSIQDEEYSPLYGQLYNVTDDEGLKAVLEEMNDPAIDGCEDAGNGRPGACPLSGTVDVRSSSDGPAPEAVVVGEACGTTYVVTVTEKNSIGFLFDIGDDITNPELVQLFHLSPASELKSAGVAYDDRTLGEVDSESITFFSEEDSPTGNPAVMFAGAFSSTLSFWEFDCDGSSDDEEAEVETETNGDGTPDGTTEYSGTLDLRRRNYGWMIFAVSVLGVWGLL